MAEYGNLRVFNVHPGMALSKVLRPELNIYAKDTGMNHGIEALNSIDCANHKLQSSFSAVLLSISAGQKRIS